MQDEPRYGMICTIPLTCACGHVGQWFYLRWCAACGEAICPTCFPVGEDDKWPMCRCSKCLEADRPLALELAGRKMAQEREERFLEAIKK